MKAVKEQKLQVVTERSTRVEIPKEVDDKKQKQDVQAKILPMPNIKNVFLDDDLLSEVRICRAM